MLSNFWAYLFYIFFLYYDYLGEVFEGSWDKNGLKTGVGRLKFSDGSLYEGKFKEGLFSGLGRLLLQDGSKFEGKLLLTD